MNMDREQFEELCAAYVIGALEGDDLRAFEQALAEADDAQLRFYRDMQQVALHMPLTAETQAPPAHIRDRVLAAIRPEASEESRQEASDRDGFLDRMAAALGLSTPRVALGISMALIVVLGAMGYYVTSLQQTVDLQQQQIVAIQDELEQKEALLAVLSAPIIEMVVMNGLEVNPNGYGKIIWDPDQKVAILQLSNLPAAPSDKDYQLWVIRDQVPVSAGIFSIRQPVEETFFRIEDLVETDRQTINAFAITLEPLGGVPQPTGPMYMLGNTL